MLEVKQDINIKVWQSNWSTL